jgi:hypothetical protein
MLRNLIVLLCVPIVSYCQRVDLDLFAGISNYQGDLQEKYFTFQRSHIAGAVNLKLQVIPNIYVRGGIMLAKLAGDDAYNSEKNRPRNLNFETTIQEFTLGAEYHFLKMDAGRLSPELFTTPRH